MFAPWLLPSSDMVSASSRRSMPPPTQSPVQLDVLPALRRADRAQLGVDRPFGARPLRDGDAPPSARTADTRAWRVFIHEDPFNRATSDEGIARAVKSVAAG